MSNFTACQRRLLKDLQKIRTEELSGFTLIDSPTKSIVYIFFQVSMQYLWMMICVYGML
jgi:hypothetical protein